MQDFISSVPVGPLFTDVIPTSGLNSNRPIKAVNNGNEQIRYFVSATQPTADKERDAIWLAVGEYIVIPAGAKFWCACVASGSINLQYADAWSIEGALRQINGLSQARMMTSDLSAGETFAVSGQMYRCAITFTSVPVGGTRWIKFTPPADKEVAITERTLSPDIAGATYHLYTNSTGFTPTATVKAYNQSDRPTDQQESSSVVQIGIVAPTFLGTDKGIILRCGKGSSPGQSGRPAGTASPDMGFTRYSAGGAGFFSEIANTSGIVQDIDVVLYFAEIPLSLLT